MEPNTIEAEPGSPSEPIEPINNPDYKLELDAERKRREQAEYALKELRKKKSEELMAGLDLDDRIAKEVEKATATLREEVGRTTLHSSIQKIASSPEEAELILHHYSHSIRQSGSLLDDLENAKLLANKPRILKENEELRRTLQTPSISKAPSSGAGQKVEEKVTPELTPFEKQLLERGKKHGLTAEALIKARSE